MSCTAPERPQQNGLLSTASSVFSWNALDSVCPRKGWFPRTLYTSDIGKLRINKCGIGDTKEEANSSEVAP